MRQKLFFFVVFLIFKLCFANTVTKDDETIYEPTWESLDSRPIPNWYDQAKVGIFIHWGVYSVPSFGSEWFWVNWRGENVSSYTEFMAANYKPGFTYQEFAKDFTGELFNPKDWVNIFKNSGAKYVVLTSKHHEGYTMWPSKYSFGWNSKDVGLHNDIVGELATAIREDKTLKFGVYHSLFEWFNPMYINDKLHFFQKNEFVDFKVIPELQEIVQLYHPEIIWSDGEWEASSIYWKSKEFLAWLYNESPVKETVVTNDRWGIETVCKHGGFHTCSDRFNPGVVQEHKWENAMTLDKQSWGHRTDAKIEDYMTAQELITELVTTVSCGGNILVNVGPNKAGIIEPIFVDRLNAMGNWLKINGAAIYDSVPWKFQNDTYAEGVWYTSTVPVNGRQDVYAIILNYPYKTDGVNLFSLGGLSDDLTTVDMLGFETPLEFFGSAESIYVTFPNKKETDLAGLNYAWTIKFNIPFNSYEFDNNV